MGSFELLGQFQRNLSESSISEKAIENEGLGFFSSGDDRKIYNKLNVNSIYILRGYLKEELNSYFNCCPMPWSMNKYTIYQFLKIICEVHPI